MLKSLAACLTLLPLLVFGTLWFLLEDEPRVPVSGARHEPQTGAVAQLQRLGLPAATRIVGRPVPQQLLTTIRTPLPRPYLNLDLQLVQRGERLHAGTLRVGRLSLPAPLVEAILPWETALKNVSAIRTGGDRHPLRLLAADTRRLQPYYDRLWRWDRQWGKRSGPLREPLRVLFAEARRRSLSGTAAAENRALLQVLAIYTNQRDPARLLGLRSWGNLHFPTLTLRGRHDLAQHFITAAAISASGGSALARYLGRRKELADFDTGSGFSFSDLAADLAGAHFGHLAVTQPGGFQRAVVHLRDEQALLPNVKGLPDHLSRSKFQHRFGHPDSPAYRRLVSAIERRIQALPLYRGLNAQTQKSPR